MADCPRCKTEIGSALYCGCGWRGKPRLADNAKDFHANPLIHCAHEACNIPAMCRIKGKMGWLNLCPKHHDQHFSAEAHDNLSRWGMERLQDETTAEHSARMRRFFVRGFKRLVVPASKRDDIAA